MVSKAQLISVKTNLIHAATLSPNIGVEVALNPKYSFEMVGGFNNHDFDDKKFEHWILWGETRYWIDYALSGHFFGLHGFIGDFDITGWEIPFYDNQVLKDYGYMFDVKGVGLSYGYQWIVGGRWVLEATIGGGFARLNYEKYLRENEDLIVDKGKKNYFGPTKGGLSLMYVF